MQGFPILAALVLLSSASYGAEPAAAAAPPQGQGQAAGAPASALPQACIDAQADDKLIKEFADRLRDAIATSGTLGLAATTDSCSLQLHVPGNLLRFQTAGGVLVSTVVIVTSQSGRYLSTSIAACQASNLKPCAARAVVAAKLALLMSPNAAFPKQQESGTVAFTVPPEQARDVRAELEQSKRLCEAQGRVFTLLHSPPHWSFSCDPPKSKPAAGAVE